MGLTQCHASVCAGGLARGACAWCGNSVDTRKPHYVLGSHILCEMCAIAEAIAEGREGNG